MDGEYLQTVQAILHWGGHLYDVLENISRLIDSSGAKYHTLSAIMGRLLNNHKNIRYAIENPDALGPEYLEECLSLYKKAVEDAEFFMKEYATTRN